MTERQERTADTDKTSWPRLCSAKGLQEASISPFSRPLQFAFCIQQPHFQDPQTSFTMRSQMATLTVIPYKPPCRVIRKPSFKRVPQLSSVKNVRFDFLDMPIEELQPAGGISWSNLQRKTVGDNEPTTHDIQASKDILGRTQGTVFRLYLPLVHLSLMLSDSLDRRKARLRCRY